MVEPVAGLVEAAESCRTPEPAPGESHQLPQVHPGGIARAGHVAVSEDANKYLIKAVQNAMVTVGSAA